MDRQEGERIGLWSEGPVVGADETTITFGLSKARDLAVAGLGLRRGGSLIAVIGKSAPRAMHISWGWCGGVGLDGSGVLN